MVFIAIFRLNIAACQLPNLLLTPVQLMMIVPLISLGNYIFGVEEDVGAIFSLLTTDLKAAITIGGFSILRGIVAWAIIAPFFNFVVYRILLHFTSQAMAKNKNKEP
jgi:hypothetical protein